MRELYLKSLSALGPNKKISTIEFSPNLTIICGASNTGKTYIFKCIKYILGSDKLDIKANSGYTSFSLVIYKNGHDIKFTRESHSNDIEVISDFDGIENGIYSTDNDKENNINAIYLKLLGIFDEFKVPYNRSCVMKRFTLRMFLHMLMINEKDIERDLSIIFPKESTNKTYFLSHLLYLLYEIDFSSYDPDDNEATKKIKKAAISQYINDKLYQLKEQKEILTKNQSFDDNYNIDEELQSLTIKLSEIERQLNDTFINGQKLLKEISAKNEKLNESLILLNRYSSLESQFTSDIQRLTFISESSHTLMKNAKNNYDNELDVANFFNVSDATITAEILRITSQLQGLMEIKNKILSEINKLNSSISQLEDSKKEIDITINSILKPAKRNIEEKIDTFKNYISVQAELKAIESFNQRCENDLSDLYKRKPKKKIYAPSELFSKTFISDITKEIQLILKACDHPKYNTASFSFKDFDIEINGNSKSTNGKGFTAFYNTIMILTIRKYLYENARIKPFFYIIDSPLLGLDVGHTHIDKNNLTLGVYNYFFNSMEHSQLIIIDNEKDMPEIDLTNPNLKYYNFTHDENEGRYGFLFDFQD